MSASHPADSLLEHAEFLRRLAQQLAGRDAEDLEQATWARSVERPPQRGDSPRGWLRTVATNLWRNERRSQARRRAREQVAHVPGEVPGVDVIAAREEVRRRVVAAVLTLPEPLREVVLLRYYEGLDSAAIGARLGRPPSTVRTQMQSALERLRARLDDEHRGERAAWAVPLLAWQRALGEPIAWTVPLGAAPIALLLVGALLAGLWFAWPGSPTVPLERATEVAVATTAAAPPTVAAAPLPADRQWLVAGCVMPVPTDYVGEPRAGLLRGTVRDAATAQPVGEARLALVGIAPQSSAFAGVPAAPTPPRHARSASDGAFSFGSLPVGLYELTATAPDGRAQRQFVAFGEGVTEVAVDLVAMPYRGVIAVKVVDAAQRAIAGAEVAVALQCTQRGPIGYAGVAALRGTTDARGLFELRDVERIEHAFEGVITARAPDGRVGCHQIGRPEHRGNNPYFEVVVDQPGRIDGVLRGPRTDWSHVRVTATRTWTYDGVRPDCEVGVAATEAAADGTFAFAALPAGRYFVHADGLDGLQRALAQPAANWQFLPSTKVVAGTAAEVVLEYSEAATVRGHVHTGSSVIANATVRAQRLQAGHERCFWHPPLDEPVDVFGAFQVRTDAAGAYELPLPDGAWHLAATADGYSIDVAAVHVVAGEPLPALDFTLVADGCLRGRIDADAVTLRPLTPGGGARPIDHGVAVQAGVFAVRGLTPGTWQVLASGDEADVPIADVTIRAGAETWIDLEHVAVGTVRGAAFFEGKPAADLEVWLGRRSSSVCVRTAPDGTFSLGLPARALAQTMSLNFAHRGYVCDAHEIVRGAGDRELGALELDVRRQSFAFVDAAGHPVAVALSLHDGAYQTERTWDLADGRLDEQWISRTNDAWFQARFRDGSTREQRVPAEATGPIVVRGEPTGSVAVRLLDRDGAPRAGGQLKVVAWGRDTPAPDDGATFAAQREPTSAATLVSTDAEGRAVARGLPIGPVLIYFTDAWGRYSYAPTAMGRLGLPPAERVVRIEAGAMVETELVLR